MEGSTCEYYTNDDFNSDIPEEDMDYQEAVKDWNGGAECLGDKPAKSHDILSAASSISIRLFLVVLCTVGNLEQLIQCLCYWVLFYPFLLVWYRLIRRQMRVANGWRDLVNYSSWPISVKMIYRVCSVMVVGVTVWKATSFINCLLHAEYCISNRLLMSDNIGVITTIQKNVSFCRNDSKQEIAFSESCKEDSMQIGYSSAEEMTGLSSLLFLIGEKVSVFKQQQSDSIEVKDRTSQVLERYKQVRLILTAKVNEFITSSAQKSETIEDDFFEEYAMYITELFSDILDTDTERQLLNRLIAIDVEYLKRHKAYKQYLELLEREIDFQGNSFDSHHESAGVELVASVPAILDNQGLPIAVKEVQEVLWERMTRQYRNVNSASVQSGAYILYPLTSDTFEMNIKQKHSNGDWKSAVRGAFARFVFSLFPNSADMIIQDDNAPVMKALTKAEIMDSGGGLCWRMVGSQGNLSIALAESIVVRRLTITFILQQQLQLQQGESTTDDLRAKDHSDWSSAPNRIELYGVNNHPVMGNKHPDLSLLGRFRYAYHSESDETQSFDMILPEKFSDMKPFRAIMIRILSNYGHPNYTTVCKVGVYGTPIRKHVL